VSADCLETVNKLSDRTVDHFSGAAKRAVSASWLFEQRLSNFLLDLWARLLVKMGLLVDRVTFARSEEKVSF
jgi:hypothetical protein